MSLAFNITRYALLVLVAVSLGTWGVRTWNSAHAAGGGEVLPADGIVVVNRPPAAMPVAKSARRRRPLSRRALRPT
jgi:hypothetical protein